MSRVVGALLMLSLMASTVCADVIPSRRTDEGSAQARRQVAERLEQLGMDQDRAVAHADGLLDQEAKFFAQDAHRIQVAGDEQVSGFPLWAFLEGTVMLGLVAGAGVWRWNVRG